MSSQLFPQTTPVVRFFITLGILCTLMTVPVLAQTPAADANADSEQQTGARPWIGIRLEDRRGGPRIAGVILNSPAAAAGLRTGDFIRHVNGQEVANVAEVIEAIGQLQPDSTAKLTISRHGNERTVTVLIGKRPTDRTVRRLPSSNRGPDRSAEPYYPWGSYYGPTPYAPGVAVPYQYYPPGYYVYGQAPYQYWYYRPGIGIQVGPFSLVF